MDGNPMRVDGTAFVLLGNLPVDQHALRAHAATVVSRYTGMTDTEQAALPHALGLDRGSPL